MLSSKGLHIDDITGHHITSFQKNITVQNFIS